MNGGPKRYVHLEPMKGTFCGKRVFVDRTKDLEMRRPWIRVALDPMTSVPLKGRPRESGDRGHLALGSLRPCSKMVPEGQRSEPLSSPADRSHLQPEPEPRPSPSTHCPEERRPAGREGGGLVRSSFGSEGGCREREVGRQTAFPLNSC